MKKLHLLCNAHLDPAWLWRREEGVAEAISTFRVAADFCEQYDAFVFNHNEALLYEWVEEHDPALFSRIKRLVKEGKWAIMGGWYLQPDCLMPSGESFLSQIELGQSYFKEKFGVTPTTAINFDPFGHSRGLVQILKKSGYDSYIMMRPFKYNGEFIWEGYDKSRITVSPVFYSYMTKRGSAVSRIQSCIAQKESSDVALCLWGIGNHGGGPSREDLESIETFRKECDVEILHSTAESFFKEVDTKDLPVVKESLIPCMVGCYTSMVQIKQAHRRLENKLSLAQKMLWYAERSSDDTIDAPNLRDARKALAYCQFHDILPGSGIRAVEEDSLRTLAYGEEIADRLVSKAFFKLAQGQKKAKDGEIPVLVFNPHPYAIEGDFEVGFILADQNWEENEYTFATVYDADGNPLPTQNEKPDATFRLDWPKKISFHATLAPASLNRFDCRLEIKDAALRAIGDEVGTECITRQNDRMKISISRKTGRIESWEVDGKPILCDGGRLEVYRDNEDPWGMKVNDFCDLEGSFSLMSDTDANVLTGYPEDSTPNVRIVEDGDVRTRIQAFFSYHRSYAIIEYTIPKNGTYVDIDLTVDSQEPNRMLKYRFDTAFSGTPMGDAAFGTEELYSNRWEATYQKWCGIVGEEDRFYILNRGTYGGSFTENSVRLSLLRTPIYAAHPIKPRQIAPHDRMSDHIDIGRRRFSFRLTTEQDVAPLAQCFNEAPPILSFFPSGDGKAHESLLTVDDPRVLLSYAGRDEDGTILRFFNSTDHPIDTTVTLSPSKKQISLSLAPYEFKTIRADKD